MAVFNLNADKWIMTLTNCLRQGKVTLIESVGNDLEPALDPILSRAIVQKGGARYIKLGGDDIE